MCEVAILKLTAASKLVGNHDMYFRTLSSVLPPKSCRAHLSGSAAGTRAMVLCSVLWSWKGLAICGGGALEPLHDCVSLLRSGGSALCDGFLEFPRSLVRRGHTCNSPGSVSSRATREYRNLPPLPLHHFFQQSIFVEKDFVYVFRYIGGDNSNQSS